MAERHRANLMAGAMALLAALFLLALSVGSASAAFIHKNGASGRFGTDGTESGYIYETVAFLAINQAAQRLYAGASGGDETKIYGFSLPHTPYRRAFSDRSQRLWRACAGSDIRSPLLPIFFRGIYGWDVDGNPLNPGVYPIAVESHEDQDSAAVDSNGNLWIADSNRGQLQEFNATTGVLIKTLNV